MTAAEKANQLGNMFYDGSIYDYDKEGHLKQIAKAKERALICVDEIIKENERINKDGSFPTPLTEYWKEVKQEIIKL
jgi:acyl CoA:acetate/3-ketoacid CoA transferase alpha subunit